MSENYSHWTERSPGDYEFRLVSDFLRLIYMYTESDEQGGKKLSFQGLIALVRQRGLKVALLAYNDGDPKNMRGPILPDIFIHCWEKCGKPRDFFELEDCPNSVPPPKEGLQSDDK